MPSTPTSTRRVRAYRPDNRFGTGAFAALAALAGELIAYRSHIRILFISAFKIAYTGSFLGVIWQFVLPIIPISVYLLLVHMRVFPRLEGISPEVFIGFNVTLWYLFTGFVRQPIEIVASRNSAMMKTSIPLSAAIAASFANLTFDTIIRLIAVAALIMFTLSVPVPSAALALGAILAGVVFCLGLGLGLAVVNAVYSDVSQIVSIALQYGIFLSGVIFPISSVPALGVAEFVNPFAVFVHAARELTFSGELSHPIAFATWSALGVFLLLGSARFFYIMEYRLRGLS
ncbi:MAG: ABC transporter permease [Hyphomonadaceae bacterium]